MLKRLAYSECTIITQKWELSRQWNAILIRTRSRGQLVGYDHVLASLTSLPRPFINLAPRSDHHFYGKILPTQIHDAHMAPLSKHPHSPHSPTSNAVSSVRRSHQDGKQYLEEPHVSLGQVLISTVSIPLFSNTPMA